MSIFRRLTRNAGLVLFAGVGTKVFSFVFIAYAARVLGPRDFGIYALINTIAFLFPIFANMGIGPMAIREMARDKARIDVMFNHIISVRMALVIVFYPLLIGVVNLVGFSHEVRVLVYITGVSAIVSTLSHTFNIVYVAREKFKFPTMVTVLITSLNSVANIVILYLGFRLMGLVLVTLACTFVGALITGVWVWSRVTRFRFDFDAAAWKDIIGQSFPFAILSFLQQASTQMNTLLLAKLPGSGGAVAIGFYNPAVSLCRQAMILPNSFGHAALPTVSSNAGDLTVIKGIVMKSTKALLVLVAFPLVLVTSFFPREIITLVFGPQYLPSVPALVLIGWAFALHIYNAPVSVVLSASRDIKKLIPWSMLIFSVNIVLAVPLIMYYSFIGAAVAYLVSIIVETFLRHHLLRIIWGLQVDTYESLLKFIMPMALIFLTLLVAHLISVGTIQLMFLTVLMYSVYLYYNNALGRIAGYIFDLRGRF